MSEYDVLVVGAGAAGCVAAARLAAVGRKVCLVEAGPDLGPEVPDDFRDGWEFPRRHEWGFESAPDEAGRTLPLRRGRLVGGTSWVTRFALRGSPADFDTWVRRGCDGWSFDEVLPWLCKVEADLEFAAEPWHGSDGPMPITRYPQLEDGPFTTAFRQACEADGIAAIEDHNAPGVTGVGRMPMTSRNGRRVTTADAYLRGDLPPSLTLMPNTLVTSVRLHGDVATGVQLADGSTLQADHVILCAGVYGSPTLLMRSGVGPAEHVQSIGIPVAVDLPGVGSNLSDHPQIWLDPGYQGPGDERPGTHTLATFRSSHCNSEEPPDLAFWVSEPSGDPVEAGIEVLLMTPASRGTVRLASADPEHAPVITLPRLEAPGDYERLTEGLVRARELAEHPALQALGGGEVTDLSTPDRVRDWVASERYSIPHTTGTCAMGSRPDDGAVVDSHGRVYGTDHLRVIDASVIPVPPSGFPHIITIAIAERLADVAAKGG